MASGRGQSLTPRDRADEVAGIGMWDGLFSGFCTAIPSTVAVWYGMHYSPSFAKYTNWQSRTALVIMPPLFMFGISSEQKIAHRMREMAEEKSYSSDVTEWAEEQQRKKEELKQHRNLLNQDVHRRKASTSLLSQTSQDVINLEKDENQNTKKVLTEAERERQLGELYRKSVENSGIRIVPGNSLGLHHRIANFWQENPFKILIALSVPTVGIIFKSRSSQSHLQFQSMVMHTRVMGQFSVILMLLSLMGFKGYMDANGKFVTEEDAQSRVEDMKIARFELLDRLKHDRDNVDYIENLKIRARKERSEQKELKRKAKQAKKKEKRKDKAAELK